MITQNSPTSKRPKINLLSRNKKNLDFSLLKHPEKIYLFIGKICTQQLDEIPVDVSQLHSVSVILQLTALRQQVVVLHGEGRHPDRAGLHDINGALPTSFAGILPMSRSVFTLENSSVDWIVSKITLYLHFYRSSNQTLQIQLVLR